MEFWKLSKQDYIAAIRIFMMQKNKIMLFCQQEKKTCPT